MISVDDDILEPKLEETAVDNRGLSHKRKVALTILASIFIGLGIIWLIYWLIWGRYNEYTDDAYVNGNIVQIMPRVSGTVIGINTDDTYLVQQGQTIVTLDPSNMEIDLQRASAALAETVRQVKQLFENAEQAQANLILRNADLMKAQLDFKRRVGLVGERAISREELQHSKTAVAATQAQYDVALHSLQASLALVENSRIYTHPMVESAKANFRTAYLNLQRTTIVAPVTGFVAKRNVQVGQQVSPSTAMMAIIPLKEIWVDANYKESQLERMRIGQPVTIYADAYPSVTYHGKIVGLSAGTGSAFALLPPQNATGNWIKIVQRLPVRIELQADELKKQPLQIGLSIRATVDTYHLKGSMLARKAEQKPVYQTNVYAHQLADANQLISKILEDNSPDMFLTKTDIAKGTPT